MEYDHLIKDCPNLQTEKEPEQIQQMFNLDEDQTALKVFSSDTYNNLIKTNSDDIIVDHLNLKKLGMLPPHFASKHKNRWTS